MLEKKLPGEGLKLIACLTMLIDHVGVVLFPWVLWLRIVGRIAFPIYCFLLAEGVHYTKSPAKYGLRLGFAMLISEIPFDIALWGQLTWRHQNVLVTLLLGFCALELMQKTDRAIFKVLLALPFVLLAETFRTDYGTQGVVMVLMFGLAREYGWKLPIVAILLTAVSIMTPSFPVFVLGVPVPIEMFCVVSMVPIALYSGKKATSSRQLQWLFYLFYPVHLAVLSLF